ncbi:MAG: restriction endonuclease subunit S [Candidatus Odinarchaeia archaeon]
MNNNWQKVKLCEVLEYREERPDIDKILLGEIPIVAKIGFDTGKIELRKESKTKTNMILIKPGDLVISGINAAKGAISIYDEKNKTDAAATIHYSSYKINIEKVDRKYLWYFLRSKNFKRMLIESLPGGIKTEVRPKRFLPIEIPLPPLEDQKRIVGKIELLIKRVNKVRMLKLNVSNEIDLFFQKEIEKSINSFKKYDKLSSILKNKPRNGYSANCDNFVDGTPVLTLSSVTGFSYIPSYKLTSEILNPDSHYWLKKGDLLISRSNTLKLVGHSSIYSGEPYPCIYPDLLMKLEIDEKKANKKFVLFWLQTPIVRKFIMGKAKGTSPTMKKISQGTVMNIPFPSKISLPIQCSIVNYLDSLQAYKEEIQEQNSEIIKECDQLPISILDKAFNGEL